MKDQEAEHRLAVSGDLIMEGKRSMSDMEQKHLINCTVTSEFVKNWNIRFLKIIKQYLNDGSGSP